MRAGKNFLLHSLVAAAAKTHARTDTETHTQRENFSFCSFRGERERERVLSPESFIFVEKKEGTLFLDSGFCYLGFHSDRRKTTSWKHQNKARKKEREFRLFEGG